MRTCQREECSSKNTFKSVRVRGYYKSYRRTNIFDSNNCTGLTYLNVSFMFRVVSITGTRFLLTLFSVQINKLPLVERSMTWNRTCIKNFIFYKKLLCHWFSPFTGSVRLTLYQSLNGFQLWLFITNLASEFLLLSAYLLMEVVESDCCLPVSYIFSKRADIDFIEAFFSLSVFF